MSLEDGEAYNARLMPIARGHMLPNRELYPCTFAPC